jgi:hypothetical protein
MIDFNNIFYQGDEASCVITSLANALMYINDRKAAFHLIKQKHRCLETTRRLQFVSAELGKMGYRVTKMIYFDVLSNTSKWPTVCGLTGSDGGRGHAVSVCGKVLFDGNVSHAMALTKENLNWCCAAPDVQVEYVMVHLAYRFEMFGKIPNHLKTYNSLYIKILMLLLSNKPRTLIGRISIKKACSLHRLIRSSQNDY